MNGRVKPRKNDDRNRADNSDEQSGDGRRNDCKSHENGCIENSQNRICGKL